MMKKVRGLGKGLCVLSALLLMFLAVGCDDSDETEDLVGARDRVEQAAAVDEAVVNVYDGNEEITPTPNNADTEATVTLTGTAYRFDAEGNQVEITENDDKKVTVRVYDPSYAISEADLPDSDDSDVGADEEFVPRATVTIDSAIKKVGGTSVVSFTLPSDMAPTPGDKVWFKNERGEWQEIILNYNPATREVRVVIPNGIVPSSVAIGQIAKKVTVKIIKTGPTEDDCYVYVKPTAVSDYTVSIVGTSWKIWKKATDGLYEPVTDFSRSTEGDNSIEIWGSDSRTDYRIQAKVTYIVNNVTVIKEVKFFYLEDVICETGSGSV